MTDDEETIEIKKCETPVSPKAGYESDISSALNTASLDKFLLVLDLPKVLKPYKTSWIRDNDRINMDALVYKVHGLNIPSVKVPSLSVKFGGYTSKFSSFSRSNEESVKINFTIDSGFLNYHFLYTWLDTLAGEEGFNYDAKNLKPNGRGMVGEYSTKITVFALDEYDRAVAEFMFEGAFITTLGGIEYNYRQEKEIVSSFDFDYTFMKMALLENIKSIHNTA